MCARSYFFFKFSFCSFWANIIRFNVSNVSHIVLKLRPLSTRRFVCVDLFRMHQYCYHSSRLCMQTLTELWFVRSKGHKTSASFFSVVFKRTTKPDIILVSTSYRAEALQSVYWTFDEQITTAAATTNGNKIYLANKIVVFIFCLPSTKITNITLSAAVYWATLCSWYLNYELDERKTR